MAPLQSARGGLDRRGFLGFAAGSLVTVGAACSDVAAPPPRRGAAGGKGDNLEFDEDGVCLSGVTGDDALGPYWTSNVRATNVLARPDQEGQRLVVMGRAVARDCITVVPGALIVAWQADDAGLYDYNHAGLNQGSGQGALATAETNLRGYFRTSDAGTYSFETIVPSEYPLNLLDPANSAYRAPHIHFAVSWRDLLGSNHQLVTQMYFAPNQLMLDRIPELDQLNAQDGGASSAETSRFLDVSGGSSGMWMGQFDIVLDVDPSQV